MVQETQFDGHLAQVEWDWEMSATGFHLTENAGTWFSSLAEETTSDWALFQPAFKKHFLQNEPVLITESLPQLLMGWSDIQ